MSINTEMGTTDIISGFVPVFAALGMQPAPSGFQRTFTSLAGPVERGFCIQYFRSQHLSFHKAWEGPPHWELSRIKYRSVNTEVSDEGQTLTLQPNSFTVRGVACATTDRL